MLQFLKNLSLGKKLIGAFLLLSLIPLLTISGLSLNTASRSLSDAAFNQLLSIREIKKTQIERFFDERKGDMGVLVETAGTLRREAMNRLEALRDSRAQTVSAYFNTIDEQVKNLASDPATAEALRRLDSAFARYDGEPADSATGLVRFYQNTFAERYAAENDGKSIDGGAIAAKLGRTAAALQRAYISGNANPLGSKHLLDTANDGSLYSREHTRIHPTFRRFLEAFGYYDIFLLDNDGNVVYSVYKEVDFATSLKSGPWADSGLASAYQSVQSVEQGASTFIDFKVYRPSYDAPAGFFASPVFDGDRRIGSLVFQFPIDRLNAIMADRSGLGETGETYLVGPDKLMRSDSYLDPEHHSVISSFRQPDKGRADTEAVRLALKGQTDADVIIDYNGNPVLSAYRPVDIGNTTWALLAEVDVAEAFSPTDASGEEFFAKYIELYGYYDLFLMNPDGYVFYTATRESDYQTNMLNGKYAESNLGQLVQQVIQSKAYGFADFSPYAPSNGKPAAFIAQPFTHNGNVELVIALQLPLKSINSIMQQREGMGETGEAYLVGPDYLMRSDSYLDPENHSVVASFENPGKGKVRTEAAIEALNGKSGQRIITDYNGNPVLSAFAPITIEGTRWALLAEIDEAEAFAAVSSMQKSIVLVVLIAIGIVVAVALLITRSITSPVSRVVAIASQIAEGNLKQQVTVDRDDEIGKLLGAMSRMIDKLKLTVGKIKEASHSVSSASAEIAQGNLDLSQRTEEQASSLEETASSMEELTSTVRQTAENANQAKQLASGAHEVANKGTDVIKTAIESMAGINESSKKIADIIGLIDEIAFQTNLLALNAAVEAARAGEQGRGFAVVAGEVRNLAQRSAESAKQISTLISDSVSRVEEGSRYVNQSGETLTEIVKSIAQVNTIVNEIAAATDEQSSGIEQINQAVMQMDQVTQQNAALVEEASAAAKSLDDQARNLQADIDYFKVD